MKRFVVGALSGLLALASAVGADDTEKLISILPSTQPTTKPTTKPALPPLTAKISPDAKALLDQMTAAYGELKSLEVAGTISFDGDIAGKKEQEKDDFTGSFAAPNKFRHEMKGNMVAGSTGEKAYVLSVEENTYIQKEAPKDRVAADEAPRAIWDVLMTQNPSVGLALASDMTRQLVGAVAVSAASMIPDVTPEMLEKGTEVSKVSEVNVGGTAYPALKVSNAMTEWTLAIDPKTHLLRQVIVDQKKLLETAGQVDVKKALLTLDYATVKPGAKVAGEQFAWAAPANARELTATAARHGGGSGEVASPLVGKPAPDFKLPGLDGKDVSLSEQKGSVVVVDFWATWCGPCVESLPHLNKLYEDKKGAGLKVLAVSVDQDRAKVPPFVAETKLTLKVLLDSDEQSAAEKYGVTGIPQTVVIGKDGMVKKVFVGGDPEAIAKAVDEALK